MMNSMSERDQRTLRMGAIGVVLILLFMLVVSPAMDRLEAVNKKLAADQKKLNTIGQSLAERERAAQAVRDLTTKATLYTSREDLNNQTAGMLAQVQKLGGYRRLSVKRLEGLPLRDEEDYYRSSVSLQFSGSLGDVQQFLRELEGSAPRLKVDRMSLAAGARDQSLVEGQMVISAFAVVARKGKDG